MKFESGVNNYLTGDSFSSGLKAKFLGGSEYIGRIEKLVEEVRGKKVIHIGCADHIPLIESKMAKGRWLHKRLEEVSDKIVGIDINKDAIKYLKEIGVANVFELDVISDPMPEYITNEKWDYIILGEIVEHLDNPVQFLSDVNEKFFLYAEDILITAPNAFRLSNFKNALRSLEFINTDHRFWFTPFTLAKVAMRSGMVPNDFYFAHSFSRWNPVRQIIHGLFPALSDTIILRASLK